MPESLDSDYRQATAGAIEVPFADTRPLQPGSAPSLSDSPEREARPVPLVIDLDGTLLRSDLLVETAVRLLRNAPVTELPGAVLSLASWVVQGKVTLKRKLAEAVVLDPSTLPWNGAVLELIEAARDRGVTVILATASHRLMANQIAGHLGLFDDILATEGNLNLSGTAKRDRLIASYGRNGFDYVGNSREDLPVWAAARRAVVVDAYRSVEREARAAGNVSQVIRSVTQSLPLWMRALRLHQWVKNLLIFVPLLASHGLDSPSAIADSILAFLVFGLCASSVYLSNDILDLDDDRRHPRKRNRPFASGELPVLAGVAAAPSLLAIAVMLSVALLPVQFTASLIAYFAFTAAYSLVLKRLAMIDVITLGLLYTIRIIAGAFAIGLDPSFWLLAFSLFIFQSLALVKRYSELHDARTRGDEGKTPGRGYYPSDLPILASLGTATGGMAVLVLAFYIQDPLTAKLYSQPMMIWLACPLLLLWISRVWLLTHRGDMHEDPIVFAVHDRVSVLIGLAFGLTFILAT